MSGWDAYVAALKVGNIQHAAIIGRNPVGVWAHSGAFYQAGELEVLVAALTSQASFDQLRLFTLSLSPPLIPVCAAVNNFKINGQKFLSVGSEFGKVIRGKSGENACAAALSGQTVIIAVGKGSPQEISGAAEKMATDLTSKGQ